MGMGAWEFIVLPLTLTSTDQRLFRGLQVKATRSTGNTESLVGRFVHAPANKTKIITCEGGYKNMATHANADDVHSVVLIWRAPDENVGDIVFTATILETFTVFWYGLTATLNTDNSSPLVPAYPLLGEVLNDLEDLDLSTCGSSKGCFLWPRYCSGSDCKAATTFWQDGDHFRFELMATGATYVGIGISDDVKMGGDETLTCTANDVMMSVQHGFNPDLWNHRMVRDQLSDVKVRASDGRIMCSFRRPRVAVTRDVDQEADHLHLHNVTTMDLHDDFYILMAWGYVKLGTDVIRQHFEMPPVTDQKVSFRSNEIYRGSILSLEARTHAALMVVAWVTLVGLTTAMSRYFKPWLGKRVYCGTNMWFQVHRGAAVLAGLLTVSSVILIFVYIGGFTELEENEHAIVGLTVASMVVVQILAGMLRPDKGDDSRPIFNWVHRILGQCAHILSAAAMFLAFYIRYIPAVMRDFGVAVLSTWVAVQVGWTVVFELRQRCCKKADPAAKPEERTLMQELITVDSLLLFFYVVTLLALGAATLTAILIF
nr:hypothetical protein BaRGS_017602 [Batillaria attramentaria]